MNRITLITLVLSLIVSGSAVATNPNHPHFVEVQNTVDVEVQNTLEVEVLNSAPVEIDELPDVEIAPGQSVIAEPPLVLPGEVLILQGFIGSTSTDTDVVVVPKDMILRSVTMIPSGFDSDPNLRGCSSSVRWSAGEPIDPASTDRYIVSFRWEKFAVRSLNYTMPYALFLPQGTELDVTVGRIGASGSCGVLVNLTGTTI